MFPQKIHSSPDTYECDLIKNRVLTDIKKAKIRSYWIRVIPKTNNWSPYDKRNIWTQAHIRRMPCDDRCREWRHAFSHQGTARIDGDHQGLGGRPETDAPSEHSEK